MANENIISQIQISDNTYDIHAVSAKKIESDTAVTYNAPSHTFEMTNGENFIIACGEANTTKIKIGDTSSPIATQAWVLENAGGSSSDGTASAVAAEYLGQGEGDNLQFDYYKLEIDADHARFGDDNSGLQNYMTSFHVAADDITIYTKEDIYIGTSTGEDITIYVNQKPIATQDWVNSGEKTFESIYVGSSSASLYISDDGISRDGPIEFSCQDGFNIKLYEGIEATINDKPIATQEWVNSGEKTFESIQVGDPNGILMSISKSSISTDGPLTLSASDTITIDATEQYSINLSGKELLFNGQPLTAKTPTVEGGILKF